jgi:hypothetical protein
LKKLLLKYILFISVIILQFPSAAVAQVGETSGSDYYYNYFDTNLLGAFGTASSGTTIALSTPAAVHNISTANGYCLTSRATGANGYKAGAFFPSTSLTAKDWEWSVLYQCNLAGTSAATRPTDITGTTGIPATANAWRYWLYATNSNPTLAATAGFFITQGTNGKIQLFRKEASGTPVNILESDNALTYGQVYNIKVQRLITSGGVKWVMYIGSYLAATPEATSVQAASSTYTGTIPTTYTSSILESASQTTSGNNIFKWDEFKMYTRKLVFTAVNGTANGITPSPVLPNSTVILYGMQISTRGTYNFSQIYIGSNATNNGASSYLNSAGSLYKSDDDTFSITDDGPAIAGLFIYDAAAQNNGITTPVLNDVVAASGDPATGLPSTASYYFISATTKTPFPATPNGTLQYTGVANIFDKSANNTSMPTSTYTNTSGSINGNVITFATPNDWTGGTSVNWNNPANWSSGAVPTSASAVRIGVVAYTRQPTITAAPANIGSLTFGTLSGTSPTAANTTLTVNSGFTLEVLGDIVQNHQAGTSGNYSSYITTLTGAGNITCDGNFQVGNTTTAPASTSANLLDISSRINLLTIKGNVILNAVGNNATGLNYPAFDIDDKKVLLNGQIVTTATNNPTNNYYSGANANYSGIGIFCMDNNSNASTLELTNNTPIANFLTNMIIDFNNNGSGAGTVIYNSSSGNQTVYTQANTPYVGTNPDHYENLILTGASTKVFNGTSVNIGGSLTSSTGPVNFNTNNPVVTIDVDWVNGAVVTQSSGLITVSGSLTNSGTLNLGSANLAIFKNYTNTGTYNQGSGTTIFNGATQILTSTGSVTKFNNVTFQGSGTKTMSTINGFSVAPLYTLNVLNSTLAVTSTASTTALTLLSTSTGDASIGDLSTAGSVTGNINVQRYMKGGTTTGLLNGRGYRLISSPVANTTGSGSLAYTLAPLLANTLITGPSGGGFDASPSATPSVFMYDENTTAPPAPNNSVSASDYKGFSSISDYVPMGNGIMFYFRGDKTNPKSTGSGNPYTATFPVAENTTLNFFGSVLPNTGISVVIPTFKTAPQSLYKTSATTSVTFSTSLSNNGATAKSGYNIIGNPYASALDLEDFYSYNRLNSSNGTNGLSRYNYFLTRSSTTYATSFAVFDASGGQTPQTGASRYMLSGQAIFVRATNPAINTFVNFTEAMKAPYPNGTGTALVPSVFSLAKFAGTKQSIEVAKSSDALVPTSFLRLELKQDSVVYNTTDLRFTAGANDKFDIGEDAEYIAASGQSNRLYSQSTDSVNCFVKGMPDLQTTKKVTLRVAFNESGLYTINAPIKTNFPPQYVVYLVDTYLKDSLDVTHNPAYNFRVDKSVAASYAADRFYLSVNKVPGYEYRLLDFAGDKITQGVKLNWKTEFEGDNTGFDVERSVDGGKSFIYLGALRSSGIGTYAFTDKSPQVGTNLYRLKQTDIDNKIVYSKIVTIGYQLDNRPLTGLMVYPSTTTRDITISFGKVYADNIKVTMSNALGNVVKTFKTSATDKILSQVSALPVGVYIVTAVDESTGKVIGTSKFVKQ